MFEKSRVVGPTSKYALVGKPRPLIKPVIRPAFPPVSAGAACVTTTGGPFVLNTWSLAAASVNGLVATRRTWTSEPGARPVSTIGAVVTGTVRVPRGTGPLLEP